MNNRRQIIMNMMSDDGENNSESEHYETCTPPDIRLRAENAKNKTMPRKSIRRYEQAYDLFFKWKADHGTTLTSENVLLAYFEELSSEKAPNTFWYIYSMLKRLIKRRENIDIKKYVELQGFLKVNATGYQPIKVAVFLDTELDKFLLEASDDSYLLHKVVIIFGINGAMRCDELLQLQVNDVNLIHDAETMEPMFLIKIRPETTKTNVAGSFTISRDTRQDNFDIVSKYRDLRPKKLTTMRFFINYQNRRCTAQPVGIHKISKIPKQVAEFLNLSEPQRYTGHSLRRTSATKAAHNGASMLTLKSLGRWQSEKVACGYIEDSITSKKKTEKILHSSDNTSSKSLSSLSTVRIDTPRRKSLICDERVHSNWPNENHEQDVERFPPDDDLFSTINIDTIEETPTEIPNQNTYYLYLSS